MNEKLKPVSWKKGPKELHNERVAIEKREYPLCWMYPLSYDVYDLENYQCLGTCEVWYQENCGKKILVLKELCKRNPIFSEILAIANQVICN